MSNFLTRSRQCAERLRRRRKLRCRQQAAAAAAAANDAAAPLAPPPPQALLPLPPLTMPAPGRLDLRPPEAAAAAAASVAACGQRAAVAADDTSVALVAKQPRLSAAVIVVASYSEITRWGVPESRSCPIHRKRAARLPVQCCHHTQPSSARSPPRAPPESSTPRGPTSPVPTRARCRRRRSVAPRRAASVRGASRSAPRAPPRHRWAESSRAARVLAQAREHRSTSHRPNRSEHRRL